MVKARLNSYLHGTSRRTRFSVVMLAIMLLAAIVVSIPQVFALFSNPAGGSPSAGSGYVLRQPAAVTNGLVAHYKFDGDTLDSVQTVKNDLTDNNTVTQVAGKVGNGGQFTAANSEYLSLSDNSSFSPGNYDFTVAGWVYLDSVGADRNIISKFNNSNNNREYRLYYSNSTSRFTFMVSADGGSTTYSVGATTFGTPSITTWYYVVAWHDATANTINIQINNGAVDSTAHTLGVYDGNYETRIGAINSGNYMDGRIDELGYWKRPLTTTERTSLYNSGNGKAITSLTDPEKDKLLAYWGLEEASGTRYDNYGVALHGKNDGTATNFANVASNYTTTTAKFGKGLTFDGINDFVSQGSDASLNITGNITVSFWGKFVGASIMCVVCGFNPGDATTGYQVWMNYASSGKMRFKTGNIAVDTTYASFNDGNLHHFAASLSGTTVSLYIDGIWEKDATVGVPTTWTGVHSIGAKSDATLPTNGTLDDVRIYNRALTAAEISTIFGGSPPLNSDQRTVGWWKLDENAASTTVADSSGRGNTGTAARNTNLFSIPGIFAGGLKFNGSSDYVDAGNSSSLSSVDAISVGAWINSANPFINYSGIVVKDVQYGLLLESTTGKPSFRVYNNAGGISVMVANSPIAANTWYYVVGVCSEGGDIRIYVNGVLAATPATFSASIWEPGENLLIGKSSVFNTYFSGSIDDVRVYNRALTANEINEMYLAGRP